MSEAGYPFVDLHVRQHQRFFEYFDELRGEIESGEEDRIYLAIPHQAFPVTAGWSTTSSAPIAITDISARSDALQADAP
jgi:hypothetical protein